MLLDQPPGGRVDHLHQADLFRRQQEARELTFEDRQTAATKQGVILAHPGDHALPSRDREHRVLADPEQAADGAAPLGDRGLDRPAVLPALPEDIDPVETDQGRPPRGAPKGLQMALPNLQVTRRGTAVRGEQENDRLGGGEQARRQLGLAPQDLHPWGVDDHEPLFQQRVREAHYRIPPPGDLDGVGCGLVSRGLIGLGRPTRSDIGCGETQPGRLCRRHRLGAHQLLEGRGHLLGGVRVQRIVHPLLGIDLERG